VAIVTLQDITEQVMMEAELRHGRDRLVFAQRMGRIGNAEMDLRTGAFVRSEEFSRLLGMDAASPPKGLDEIVSVAHPDDREKLRESFVRMRAGRPVPSMELRIQRPDGEIIWVRRDQEIVMGADGTAERAVVTLQDITSQKALDQQKDEFVSNINHELRTPLTSIRGALQLVLASRASPLPEKMWRLLDIANRNSDRLAGLVDDLLDVQRIREGRMVYRIADVAVSPIVVDSIEATRTFAGQREVEVKLRTDDPTALIRADAQRVGQVMANLLSNAIKFSRPGQVVEVDIERRSPWVRITVQDHGEGIPEAFRSQMFKHFSQSDGSHTRKHGGSGLGLSIVEAIVSHHEGRISFDSELGAGTSFYIDLKEVAAAVPEAEGAPERVRDASGVR
jgi:PAS domain S-box-containing protein